MKTLMLVRPDADLVDYLDQEDIPTYPTDDPYEAFDVLCDAPESQWVLGYGAGMFGLAVTAQPATIGFNGPTIALVKDFNPHEAYHQQAVAKLRVQAAVSLPAGLDILLEILHGTWQLRPIPEPRVWTGTR